MPTARTAPTRGRAYPLPPAASSTTPTKHPSATEAATSSRTTRPASAPVKQRLFAHPDLPSAREAGGLEQQLEALAREGGKFETYENFFSRPFGLEPSKVRVRAFKKGARVIGGTIIGRVGQTVPGKASHLDF